MMKDDKEGFMRGGHIYPTGVISLRDYFAAAALTGTFAASTDEAITIVSEKTGITPERLRAEISYETADAMLAARQEQSK